jgi:hypothetical protein
VWSYQCEFSRKRRRSQFSKKPRGTSIPGACLVPEEEDEEVSGEETSAEVSFRI